MSNSKFVFDYRRNEDCQEGFNICWFYIKQIAALSESEREELYGHRTLTAIFEDADITDLVDKYLGYKDDFHVGDEVVLKNTTKNTKLVVMEINASICKCLYSGGITNVPKYDIEKTGRSYSALKGILEELGN